MRIFLICLITLGLSAPACADSNREDYMRLYSVEGNFEDVREDLELAITARGMIINNVSHIGNMLARTRKDVGSGKQIFVQAEALEFCSSVISRKMMEADPHNIIFCPYIISVYSLPAEKDKVYLAYRRPLAVGSAASKKALQAVEDLLASIVADVVE
ncbi:MAG: DUF302 domain-containing protein [Gammaproteobacteria bacterium]|nr:DUF302 domain-containing protein [Gammaproteobacteria bacterium]